MILHPLVTGYGVLADLTFADVNRRLLSHLGSAPAKNGLLLLFADHANISYSSSSSIEDEIQLAILN
jgi:hypothetical protein